MMPVSSNVESQNIPDSESYGNINSLETLNRVIEAVAPSTSYTHSPRVSSESAIAENDELDSEVSQPAYFEANYFDHNPEDTGLDNCENTPIESRYWRRIQSRLRRTVRMDDHEPLPPIIQTVTHRDAGTSTEELQGHSSHIDIDKGEEHIENMDVDESLPPTSPSSQYSNSHSTLSVPSVHRQNDVFLCSLDSEETNGYPSCSRNMDKSLSVLSTNYQQDLPSEHFNGMPSARVGNLANKLIKLSRCLKTLDFESVSCLTCRNLPVRPVTAKCGHTRCMRCIVIYSTCPCGTYSSIIPNENVMLRDIIQKMIHFQKTPRLSKKSAVARLQVCNVSLRSPAPNLQISNRRLRPRGILPVFPRIPMTTHAHYKQAQKLMSMGLYAEAAPHLARSAASVEPCSRLARRLLHKTVDIMCHERGQSRASHELSLSIREQSLQSWLKPADLECVLCTNTLREPVSTPCGHTFCRCCIERDLFYRQKCALCSTTLKGFNIDKTSNNVFFDAILKCLDIPPLPMEPDVIPVVISYVAFPGMPCPLYIKNARHWTMIQRVLKSGSRRFGIVSYERDHILADFGMILEIRDCVTLKDNQCIVSTVGISRFQVIERDVRDGCDVARIRHLIDITPTKEEVEIIHTLTENIVDKALTWLENMTDDFREEVETAFGYWTIWQETQENSEAMWSLPNGPKWLWWLIAILPLKKELKVRILSAQSLVIRMVAVLRTFEAIDDFPQ